MKGYKRERPPGSGRWQLIVYAGLGPDGKQKQRTKTIEGTTKDADKALRALLAEVEGGQWTDPGKLTVGAYLEQWLRDYADVKLEAKTAQEYRGHLRSKAVPRLGKLPLAKLSPLHLEEFLAWCLREGKQDGTPLSGRTTLHLYRILNRALSQAVKWKLLTVNPLTAVEPPKAKRYQARALSVEETVTLLSALEGTRFWLPSVIALGLGLRRGEVLALKWGDLDLERGVVDVQRSMEQTVGKLSDKARKNDKPLRLPLPDALVTALRQQKGKQAEERLLVGRQYKDRGFVFAKTNGDPWLPDQFSTEFRAALKAKGLPLLRFHDLRHSHASQLIEAGEHLSVISKRLGHSGIAITHDTYAHLLPGVQERASKTADGILKKAMGGGDG